ncbi:MAG: hypothetical protein ABJB12_14825 [Pseudomonadota bacterium]
MRRPFSLKHALVLAFALSACLTASCSENGATPVCPPLPRYQTTSLIDSSAPDGDVAGAGSIDAARARAVDAGCVAAPTFFPSEAGAGGAAGADNGNGGADGNSAGALGAQH